MVSSLVNLFLFYIFHLNGMYSAKFLMAWSSCYFLFLGKRSSSYFLIWPNTMELFFPLRNFWAIIFAPLNLIIGLDLISKCCSWHCPVTWFWFVYSSLYSYYSLLSHILILMFWTTIQSPNWLLISVRLCLYYRLIILWRYFQDKSTHITLFWNYVLENILLVKVSKVWLESCPKHQLFFTQQSKKMKRTLASLLNIMKRSFPAFSRKKRTLAKEVRDEAIFWDDFVQHIFFLVYSASIFDSLLLPIGGLAFQSFSDLGVKRNCSGCCGWGG